MSGPHASIGYVLRDFPKLSETFVLTELLELERQGVPVQVYAHGRPVGEPIHARSRELSAPVTYFPSAATTLGREAIAAFAAQGGGPRRVRFLARYAREPRTMSRAAILARWSREHDVGHLHAHFASAAASTALATHRLTGIPYSFTAHAVDIFGPDIVEAELADKLASARFVVTVSEYNRRYLMRIAPTARVVRIYNGLDLDLFTPHAPDGSEQVPLVLAVGRLEAKKGFDDFLRGCAILQTHGLVFRAVLVGDGSLRSDLEGVAAALGLGDAVRFTGPLPNEEVRRFLAKAAVVVVPSVIAPNGDREGLPTILLEAMAMGVPTVTTDSVGIPEVARHETTALVVPEHDPQAIAYHVARLLSEPALAELLARSARDVIEHDFDVKRSVRYLRDLFSESVRRPEPADRP